MKKKKTVPMKQAIPRSEEAPPDASVEIPVDMSVSTPVADTFSHSDEVFPIVGIGTSAGGLEKARKELEVTKISEDAAREYAESVINTVREPLIVLNQDLRVVTASRSFYEVFKVNPKETVGQLIYDLGNKQWDIPKLRELLETILSQKATFDNYEVEHDFADIGRRIMLLNARQIERASGKERIILLAIEDITARKEAEEELLESEEKYRNILENIEDGYFEVDLAGNFTFFNPSLCRILGYNREEMPGMNNRTFMDAENAKKVFQAFNEIYVTGIPQKGFDWETIRKDGARMYIEVSVSLIARPEEKPTGFRGIARDITERRRAEAELRESEEKFRNLVESINDVIYEIDSQGVIVYVSPIVKDVFGYDPADAIGKNFIEFVYKDDRSLLMVLLSDLRTGRTTPSEYRLTDKSGDLRWVRTRTRPIMEDGRFTGGARGTIIDITERKQAEEAQRKAEESYRSIFENAVEGIFQTTADGRFLSANPALAYILGYESPEDLMASVTSIGGQLYVSHEAREEHLRVVTEKGQVKGFEAQVRRKDGSIRWISMNTRLVRDDVGNFVEGFAEDITERRRAEEELAKKAEELARSNAELEQFASVASHDLQEPLRMISSYVQLLARHNQGKLDADSQEFIAFAADGATRMQALIQDLLAFSRVGTRGKPFVPTDCEAVLERALNHLKVAIEESGARITSDPLPMLRADDSQLVQLFQNLVGNALKFYRPGVPPVIHIGAKRSGQDWVFAVCDNGIGIPAEQKQRVFEIFQRLHSRGEYPGTGIGLAVCRKIVERHGGRIWVESAVGEGSTFTFALPQGNGNRITSPDEPSK